MTGRPPKIRINQLTREDDDVLTKNRQPETENSHLVFSNT
jgi:hypothetical protein